MAKQQDSRPVREVPNSLDVVSFERVPGFVDRLEMLEGIGQIDEPLWVIPKLPPIEFLKFTYETGKEWSERTIPVYLREESYGKFILNKGMHKILDGWRRCRVVAEEELRVWAPVAEIHHPGAQGCSAWMEHEKAITLGISGEIKLFGSGGGSGAEATIAIKNEITLNEPPCVEVLLPLKVRVQLIESRRGKWPHVHVVDVESGFLGNRELDPSQHWCGLSEDKVKAFGWRLAPISLAAGSGTSKISEKMGMNRGFNGSIGLEIGGVTAKVEASAKWSESVTWGYVLPLGREYLAYRPNYATGLLWSKP